MDIIVQAEKGLNSEEVQEKSEETYGTGTRVPLGKVGNRREEGKKEKEDLGRDRQGE